MKRRMILLVAGALAAPIASKGQVPQAVAPPKQYQALVGCPGNWGTILASTVVDPSGSCAEFSWKASARQKGYEDTYLVAVDQTASK